MTKKNFRVTWVVDLDDQEDARSAALVALEIQRDPNSIATVFEVEDRDSFERWTVDLMEWI